MSSRLRGAKLRHTALLEDIDYRNPHGLDKGLLQPLAPCQWVKGHLNVIITGPTGVGKSWLACALAHKACRAGYTVQYIRLTRLLQDLMICKGDGPHPTLLANLARVDVLVLDDWGTGETERRKSSGFPGSAGRPSRQALHHRHPSTAHLGVAWGDR